MFHSGIMADVRGFANLWKSPLDFVMSVRMDQLGYHWTYFHEIWFLKELSENLSKYSSSVKQLQEKRSVVYMKTNRRFF